MWYGGLAAEGVWIKLRHAAGYKKGTFKQRPRGHFVGRPSWPLERMLVLMLEAPNLGSDPAYPKPSPSVCLCSMWKAPHGELCLKCEAKARQDERKHGPDQPSFLKREWKLTVMGSF